MDMEMDITKETALDKSSLFITEVFIAAMLSADLGFLGAITFKEDIALFFWTIFLPIVIFVLGLDLLFIAHKNFCYLFLGCSSTYMILMMYINNVNLYQIIILLFLMVALVSIKINLEYRIFTRQ